MGSRRCDSNISALRVPSVWRISVICLIARLHLGATHQIPVCALKDLQVEMVSDLICSWSNGSSICSSLEDCSTKPIICDVNNTQVSIACRIIYERKGQKCINLTGTSKDKQCYYSNELRIHDREGCINDSSVTCYRDHKCDSKCRAYGKFCSLCIDFKSISLETFSDNGRN
ncbi:hypothetical protein JZ751_018601 [Albula glossodonta]|uniref:Uncharacterized protein n=1 Tax=Albula glossodonta TaxID=121402 RepID=A0A8T2NZT1_9TELE|nr:hypothetical protein JZ751_018601 [Albula glossodonta]